MKPMRTIPTHLSVCATLFLLTSILASAQVPLEINYQGRLTSDTGQPLTGSMPATFEIIKGGTAIDTGSGTPVHSESATIVADGNGVFSYKIGSGTGIDLTDLTDGTDDRFIQVTINPGTGAETLIPRQQLLAVPYAVVSKTLGDGDASIMRDGAALKVEAPAIELHGAISALRHPVPQSFSVNTTYLAARDAIVSAYVSSLDAAIGYRGYIQGYSDSSSPPTTLRAGASAHLYAPTGDNMPYNSICFPVRKGDYWRIVFTHTSGSGTQTGITVMELGL